MKNCSDVINLARQAERQFIKTDTITKIIRDSVIIREASKLSTELDLTRDSMGLLINQFHNLKIGNDSLTIIIMNNKLKVVTSRSDAHNISHVEFNDNNRVQKEYIKELVPSPYEVVKFRIPKWVKILLYTLTALSIPTIIKIIKLLILKK